jgi:5-guanidino-2-oxopentanoate decarboxylase
MSVTVGRFLVDCLAANDVETAFGIPGVHNIELYRGLDGSTLRHVLMRHEQGAGFAADGYARISGRLAAAFVISGPGLTNILTAVAQAGSDSVPLLVIASAPVRAARGKQWGVLHELRDQAALAAGVFGLAREAWTPEDVRDHLRACLASLRGGRAKPAYLQVPLDLLAQTTDLIAERFADSYLLPQPQNGPLQKAIARLDEAQRPMVIAGGGARCAGLELADLVDKLDGFFASTAAGKGLLPENHPANLGTSLPYAQTQALAAAADVVLIVGSELGETDLYTGLKLPLNGRLIRIDVDTGKLSDHYGAETRIWGDAHASLVAIAGGVRARRGWRSTVGPAALVRAQIEAGWTAEMKRHQRALQAIQTALPVDAVVFSDMTQIAYLGNYAFRSDQPGRWFHPSGYGTLGYALPAAIGAKFALPQRAVLALAGDFGLQFTLNELMTAVEAGMSLPIVVWNNAALGQIRDDMIAAGIAPVGVAGLNPDFVALARACHARGVQVRSPGELTAAVRDALDAPVPTLIEIDAAQFA